jgi:hypothetical protein
VGGRVGEVSPRLLSLFYFILYFLNLSLFLEKIFFKLFSYLCISIFVFIDLFVVGQVLPLRLVSGLVVFFGKN